MKDVNVPVRTCVIALLAFAALGGEVFARDTVSPVGSTPAQFSTSPTGAARYRVPITQSPGAGGVEPSLSVMMDSSAGASFLGPRFKLNGLSQIGRCPATISQDGFFDPVNFDVSDYDRFCLDGARLVEVDGTSNEFRTEVDNFKEVRRIHQGWRVRTKSGLTKDYGFGNSHGLCSEPSASKVAPDRPQYPTADGETQLWLLSRVEDSAGDWMQICYEDFDPGPGVEVLPVSIHYTGNDSAGLSPFARVEFNYEDMVSPTKGYFLGAEQSRTKRLENITTYAQQEVVRQYRFGYVVFTPRRDHLVSIEECPSASAIEADCMNPTRFEWALHGVGYEPGVQVTSASAPAGLHQQSPGDWNADGILDLFSVYIDGTLANVRIFESRTAGAKPRYRSYFLDNSLLTGGERRALVGDFSGDGRADIAIARIVAGSSIQLNVYRGESGGGFSSRTSWYYGDLPTDLTDEDVASFVGDVNGDSRADLVFAHDAYYMALISRGGGTFRRIVEPLLRRTDPVVGQEHAESYLADVTGDGLPDYFEVAVEGKSGFYVAVFPNRGHEAYGERDYVFGGGDYSVVPNSVGAAVDDKNLAVADINGDNNADLVSIKESFGGGNYIYTFLGKGDGTFVALPRQSTIPDNGEAAVVDGRRVAQGDLNGDGITDLVLYRTVGSSTYSVRLSGTGDGTLYRDAERVVGGNNAQTVLHAIDMSGDAKADLAMARFGQAGAQLSLVRSNEGLPSRVENLSNGYGSRIDIDYDPITDKRVYSASDGCGGYPVKVLCGPMLVVSGYRVEDPGLVPQAHEVTYHYENLKVDMRGRGMLGPEVRTVTDENTDTREVEEYIQEHPNIGAVSQTTTFAEGDRIERNQYQYGARETIASFPQAQFRYLEEQVKTEYEPGSAVEYRTTQSNYHYNEPDGAFYGNLTASQRSISSPGTGTSYNTEAIHQYDNDVSQWLLGRLKRSEVTRTSPGQDSQTRVSSYEYDAVTGLLAAEIIEPGTAVELRTEYERDALGNITQTVRSGPDVDARTTTQQYALRAPNFGRGATRSCNALGHCTDRTFELAHASVESETGPNGVEVHYSYDAFGRQAVVERSATGHSSSETTERGWCANNLSLCAPEDGNFSFYVRKTKSSGENRVVVYDVKERVVAQKAQNGDGDWVTVRRQYNESGEVRRESKPRIDGGSGPTFWTEYTYDGLGRVIETEWACGEDGSDDCSSQLIYSGLQLTTTDARGNVEHRWKNALGALKRVENAEGVSIAHEYDAFENLVRTVKSSPSLSSQVVTTMEYDIRGRKVVMDDPDKGEWVYEYNAFGELVAQTDALGQTVSLEYDALGRKVYRDEPDAETTWNYDQDWVGALDSVQYDPKAAWQNPAYSRTYSYHASGNVAEERVSIGIGAERVTAYEYDAHGRLVDTVFPTGFVKRNTYNQYGALVEVTSPTTSVTYWAAEGWDAWGINESQFGNGVERYVARDAARGTTNAVFSGLGGTSELQRLTYEWDEVGNLRERADLNQGNLRETFEYDSLNRLETVKLYGAPGTTGGVTTLEMRYTSWGNIREKSGAIYEYTTSRPHAASSIGGEVYEYDANGNVTRGGRQRFQYTSFDLPDRITQGLTTVNLRYGPERQRIRKRRGLNTIDYYGSRFEEHKGLLNNVRKHHIDTPVGVVAIVDMNGFGNVTNTRYLLRDHQGSIDVVTNDAGQILQNLSFDAFGAPRAASWDGGLPALVNYETNRGYTGHEHLYSVDLIHMNGRVYNPEVGRFLSADPFVEAPGNIQAYNRYSYALNNPLTRIDPSGYLSFGDFGLGFIDDAFEDTWDFAEDNWRPIVAVAITVATGGSGGGPAAAWAAAGGFAAGYVASGGDFEAALVGAGSALLFHGAGEFFQSELAQSFAQSYGSGATRVLRVVTHGAIGGAQAEVLGGNFRSGFFAGGFTQAFSPVVPWASDRFGVGRIGRAAVAAVVGGTAAELGGGKFANGAVTGAFSRVYNDEVHIEVGVRMPDWLGKLVYGNDFIGKGLSFGVAVSYPGFTGGKYDVGAFWTGAAGGMSMGTGRLGLGIGFGAGDVQSMTGSGTQYSFTDGIGGISINFDQNMQFSGAGVHSGVGYNFEGTGTYTRSLTARDVGNYAMDMWHGR